MKNQLVILMKFTELFALRFVKEKLEFEDIECFLTDEGFDNGDNGLMEGWNLKVRAADVEKAVKILLQLNKEYDLTKIQEDDTIKGLKKILVPLDLGNYSLNTCRFAFAIAEKMNAEIKFLYVLDDPDIPESGKYSTSWAEHDQIEKDEVYAKAQSRLQKFSKTLKDEIDPLLYHQVKFHYALHSGKPENTIVYLSNRYKPNLILMEQKENTVRKKEHLANLTHSVIDQISFPVLTIPETAVFRSKTSIRVMHLTDFYETGFDILNKLLETVKPFDTKIFCIHFDVEYNPVPQDKIEWINEYLKNEYSGIDVQASVYERAHFPLGIEEFVRNNQIDWISLSSPRRSFLYKLFHPDILNKMIVASQVPVLIFPGS